jgi:hypothetical protein
MKIFVIHPAVALKIAEGMVDLRLVHSKIGLFSTPPGKAHVS